MSKIKIDYVGFRLKRLSFPFSDPKFLNDRIGTTLGLNDVKLTCFRFFTFLNMIGLCSKRHLTNSGPVCKYCGESVEKEGYVHAGGCGALG